VIAMPGALRPAKILGLLILLGLPRQVWAQLCQNPQDSLAPSRDLYCMSLVPPPPIEGLAATVELRYAPGPYSIAVTPGGKPLYAPVLQASGLPPAESMGPYHVYIAWVASPVMFPMTKLTRIENGRNELPAFAIDPFMIMVTAESSDSVSHPQGKVVLRGGSPSTRLQPPDMMQFSIGAVRQEHKGSDSTAMAGMPGMAGGRMSATGLPKSLGAF